MTKIPDFKVGDLLTPNYKGRQTGLDERMEVTVIDPPDRYGHIVVKIIDLVADPTGTGWIPGDEIGAYAPYFKKARILLKKDVDAAIKSIMTRV